MDLLTFGEVILFKGGHYVWLTPDLEEEKLHLAKVLDIENTKELIRVDKATERKHNSPSYNAPLFAYVVLSTKDFDGCAAHLMDSGGHANHKDDFSVLGKLDEDDVK